jgi:AcrR family transcriptional regulator
MSKSGVIAHFGSKLELQLSTIRAARRIFLNVVVEPALARSAGLDRVLALMESWLTYSSTRVFPGGCFFARMSHEYGGSDSEITATLAAINREWLEFVARTISEAKPAGQLPDDADTRQLAFELNASLEAANLGSLLGDDDLEAYGRARRSIRDRLQRAAIDGIRLP